MLVSTPAWAWNWKRGGAALRIDSGHVWSSPVVYRNWCDLGEVSRLGERPSVSELGVGLPGDDEWYPW